MIQPLDLNLASRPVRNNTLLWLTYGLAVVALGVFTVRNVQSFRETGEALEDLRFRVSKIERQMSDFRLREERANIEINKYDLDSLTTQASKANDVIEWKAFSWTRLFNQLERIQPYKVKMLSIRPVFHAGERRASQSAIPKGAVPVALEGIALNRENFLELERSLLLDPHFDRVEPVGTTRLADDETKFQLQCLYFPGKSEYGGAVEIPPVVELGSPVLFAEAEAAAEAAARAAGGGDVAPEGGDEAVQEPAADGNPSADERAPDGGGTG